MTKIRAIVLTLTLAFGLLGAAAAAPSATGDVPVVGDAVEALGADEASASHTSTCGIWNADHHWFGCWRTATYSSYSTKTWAHDTHQDGWCVATYRLINGYYQMAARSCNGVTSHYSTSGPVLGYRFCRHLWSSGVDWGSCVYK